MGGLLFAMFVSREGVQTAGPFSIVRRSMCAIIVLPKEESFGEYGAVPDFIWWSTKVHSVAK